MPIAYEKISITNKDLLQQFLDSISIAVTNPDLSVDSRSTLIDQYEKTASMIRDGYENLSFEVDELPDAIRKEVSLRIDNLISTFDTSVEILKASLFQNVDNKISELDLWKEGSQTDFNSLQDLLSQNVDSKISELDLWKEGSQTFLDNFSSELQTSFNSLQILLSQNVNNEISLLEDFKTSLIQSNSIEFEPVKENLSFAILIGDNLLRDSILDTSLSLGLQTINNAIEIGLIKSKIGVR